MYDNQYIQFYTSYVNCFYFSPYYDCKEVTRTKTTGNIYINCTCENTAEGCPPGNLIFDKAEETGRFWHCSLKTEKMDYWKYLKKAMKGQHPHILLKNTNISSGSIEGQYIIVRSGRPYTNYPDGRLKLNDQYFERKFDCNVEESIGNDPRIPRELLCRKDPFVFPFQMAHAVLRYSSIVFSSATLLVFILLPPLRTMKTTIILCQTFSYLIRDLMDLRFCLGGWQPSYTECIAIGRGFNGGKSRTTFLLYSLYGWGGPLIITLVTAILGFWVTLPRDFLKPDINLEHCWFHAVKSAVMYHYVPAMVLAAINVPLLGYTVYNIIKSVCTSDLLRNKDSGRHVGNKVKKKSKTRSILYFNLALLIGSPKSLQFVKLLVLNNDALVLALNSTGLLRAICMFLFVSCKKRVFILLKKRLLLESLTVSSVFTSLSSKSQEISSPKVSNSLPQESSQL
ncbi:probable G-protein coupled receptor Mth-like 2 isoform X2 [Anabrus simplex]|uniref:probable G-protein coupled receptor Mth-like 2 isoform X2 n=1 Tax=Anabrus simplex TaxID=316456 RepID=UPI0035A2A96C